MYPDNLRGKPTLWLWYLRDIGIIGIGAILSVICISQADFYLPMAIVGCYAFMTIRFSDTSIFDFIEYACAFFIYSQQFYIWLYTCENMLIEQSQTQRKSKLMKIWR